MNGPWIIKEGVRISLSGVSHYGHHKYDKRMVYIVFREKDGYNSQLVEYIHCETVQAAENLIRDLDSVFSLSSSNCVRLP